MLHSTKTLLVATVAALAIAAPGRQALAWGHTGHLEISKLAVATLPAWMPGFLRNLVSGNEIGELGAEADVSKGSGLIHDAERNPGHYVDIDENRKVVGVSPFAPLFATREAYDTAQRAGGQTQYSSGYLQYNIVDGWQQVRKDFALYRAFKVGLASADNDADRAYFKYQLELRQTLTLRDIGVWSHFIGDGSQPLHVSIHYNGWGNYPNPKNYTQKPIHAPFEGSFVRDFVDVGAVYYAIKPYRYCGCTIEERVARYLLATLAQVEPLYVLATKDPAPFTTALPAEVRFATERLAAAAGELRDEIEDAWVSSATWSVGYPVISVADIESGKVHLTRTSLASD